MSETTIRDPDHVVIYDTTLRDGAQMPRIDFNLEDRVVIASRLANMGVDIIEAGFPFAVEGDFEAARAIAETVENSRISALSRTRDGDIESAWAAIEPAKHRGGTRIHTFIGTSDSHMKELGNNVTTTIAAAKSGVEKAREFTDDVEFSPEDASRTPFKRMMRIILEAVDAGATTINVPDTVGFAVMHEYAERLRDVKKQIDDRFGEGLVVVSAHCHDDLGMATANTMAAIAAGARQAEVTIGGIGERASNTPLEEVVANIKERPEMFGDVHTSIDTVQLTPVYREVMERADLPNQFNKAIVGRNAFAHEAGIHQQKIQGNVRTYEHMPGEDYGQDPGEMVLGKLSGWRGVESRLKNIGIGIGPEILIDLSARAKTLSEKLGRQLADTDIEKLAAEVNGGAITDRFQLQSIRPDGHSVSVTLVGAENFWGSTTNSSGKGLIDAGVKGINQLTGFNGDIVDWEGHSQSSGSDALAGIFVVVKQNGHQVEAFAEGPVDEASLKAYIAAINLIERVQERIGSAGSN